MKTEGKCFKCQEPNWTPKHRCRGVNAVVTQLEIPEVLGEWERDIDSDDPLCVSTALAPMPNAAGRRPTVTLKLNGQERGNLFVDTMSDVSLISKKLLMSIDAKNQLKIDQQNVPSLVSAGNEPLKLEGTVVIPVSRGTFKFEHRFIVSANLPKGIESLLGNDILGLIGVNLGGLVVASVVEKPDLGNGMDMKTGLTETISALFISDKDTQQYSDGIYTFRLRLKEEIDHLLEENKKLTGFCTHPKAKIYFNTIDELPVGVRQYELPHAHRKIVDEQVATWFKDGIIEDCLEDDHSNNPLLSSSEKRHIGSYQRL